MLACLEGVFGLFFGTSTAHADQTWPAWPRAFGAQVVARRWPRALRRSGCASLPRAGDAQLSTVLGSRYRHLLWHSLRGRRRLPAQHGRDCASHGIRRGNQAELSAVPLRSSERLHDSTPWRRKREPVRATRPVPHDSARCSSLRRTAVIGASYRRLPARPSGTRSHRGSEGSNPSN